KVLASPGPTPDLWAECMDHMLAFYMSLYPKKLTTRLFGKIIKSFLTLFPTFSERQFYLEVLIALFSNLYSSGGIVLAIRKVKSLLMEYMTESHVEAIFLAVAFDPSLGTDDIATNWP